MSIDQQTKSRHELTDEERAAKLQELLDSEPLPMIQRSIAAFRRDLPEMLTSHRGEWVAYHGEERIGFGRSQTELFRTCLARGLEEDSFVVCGVEPGTFDPEDDVGYSPDV